MNKHEVERFARCYKFWQLRANGIYNAPKMTGRYPDPVLLDGISMGNKILLKEQLDVLTEEVRKLSTVSTPAVIKGVQGLADFLGVSKSVAQKMKNEGVIPYIQYDRVVLFEPDKILTALASQTPKYNR